MPSTCGDVVEVAGKLLQNIEIDYKKSALVYLLVITINIYNNKYL